MDTVKILDKFWNAGTVESYNKLTISIRQFWSYCYLLIKFMDQHITDIDPHLASVENKQFDAIAELLYNNPMSYGQRDKVAELTKRRACGCIEEEFIKDHQKKLMNNQSFGPGPTVPPQGQLHQSTSQPQFLQNPPLYSWFHCWR